MKETTKKIINKTILGTLFGATIGGLVGAVVINNAQSKMIKAQSNLISELVSQNQNQEDRITELEKQKQYLTCNTIATTEVTINGEKANSTSFTARIKARDRVTIMLAEGFEESQYELHVVKYEATDFYATNYYEAKDSKNAKAVFDRDTKTGSYTFSVEAGVNYFLYATYTAC